MLHTCLTVPCYIAVRTLSLGQRCGRCCGVNPNPVIVSFCCAHFSPLLRRYVDDVWHGAEHRGNRGSRIQQPSDPRCLQALLATIMTDGAAGATSIHHVSGAVREGGQVRVVRRTLMQYGNRGFSWDWERGMSTEMLTLTPRLRTHEDGKGMQLYCWRAVFNA